METQRAWPPAVREPGLADLTTLLYDHDGLLLILTPFEGAQSIQPVGGVNWSRVEIRFRLPRTFREIDEGYRPNQRLYPDDEPLAWVYVVEESSYLQEFLEISDGTLRGFELVHWFIPSINSCVDVVCETEPVVTIVPLDAA